MRRLFKKIRQKIESLPLLSKIFLSPYYVLRTSRPIRSILLKESKHLYAAHRETLLPHEDRVLGDLKHHGLAVTNLTELFPGEDLLSQFRSFAEHTFVGAKIGRKKTFLIYLWDNAPTLDLKNPFVEVTLRPTVLRIANAYLGVASKFTFYSVNKTVPVPRGSEAMGSQRWHRDPGIKRVCKMFIYVSDVPDETAGPFTYALGSHHGGRWGTLEKQRLSGRDGRYPSPELISKTIPLSDQKLCTGRAGTIIFCDTLGIHKGGYSTSRERIMFTALFETPDAFGGHKFKYPSDIETEMQNLGPLARYAVSP